MSCSDVGTLSAIGSNILLPALLGHTSAGRGRLFSDGAPGDRRRASRGILRFVDPSPAPLEPRRQRHPRDRHHGHDASHLCGYGLCPKHFRGAVRPPGASSRSRAGRQFHGARQAATGEPSLPAGEDDQAWSGVATVGRKEEWPGWTPTEGEKRRLGPLPNYVEGGASNPMGARALYLYAGGQDTLYRIHGTNQPGWIGHAISSGCIRLTNEDVIDLYSRVKMGALVVVLGPKQGASRITSASAR